MTTPPLSKVVFISTFPPRKCGIASFTQDLINAINTEINGDIAINVCALDKGKNAGLYHSPVTMIMDSYDWESCVDTAKTINADHSIKLICIEHEFGLYGGELGEYLLGFLSLLDKPFIIRMHTVLPAVNEKMVKIVKSIGLLADKIIVMTRHSARLLREDYKINPDTVAVIPHGIHLPSRGNANDLKIKYRLHNKKVLTTFGLLSPSKGIEKGILAMKEISQVFPDAVYIVLGQTHPNLVEHEGEKYRDYLQQLIIENNLQNNVKLINEYVPTDLLMEYLALTDIYLFTSKDPLQAVSGTFLYAMSAGCAIISNSFVVANEMLDAQTGVILQTDHENELAENAIRILQNPALQKEMSKNAFLKTRSFTWEKVGQKHADLFYKILGLPLFKPELRNHYIS